MKFRRQLFKYLDVNGALAMLSKRTLQFTNSLFSGYREHFHGKSARDTGEFLKSVAHFLQMLYKCYTFVIYNI